VREDAFYEPLHDDLSGVGDVHGYPVRVAVGVEVVAPHCHVDAAGDLDERDVLRRGGLGEVDNVDALVYLVEEDEVAHEEELARVGDGYRGGTLGLAAHFRLGPVLGSVERVALGDLVLEAGGEEGGG